MSTKPEDKLTLATQGVAEYFQTQGDVVMAREAEQVARVALEAAGVLHRDAQPLPQANDYPSTHDLVVKALEPFPPGSGRDQFRDDMIERKAFGYEEYGTLLQPFNRRNALLDTWGEFLDMAAYLAQYVYETEMTSSDRVRIDAARALLTTVVSLGIRLGSSVAAWHAREERQAN
jgi:hypothetical protein